MNKQTQQLAITGGLIIVLIAVALGNFKKKPSNKKTAEDVSAQEVASKQALSPAPVIPADELVLNQQLERVQLEWGRDPFSASLAKGYQLSELKLQGISFGKEKKGFAFINDEIVKEGDTIGGYEVVAVDKDKVLLKRGAQSFYLTFPAE